MNRALPSDLQLSQHRQEVGANHALWLHLWEHLAPQMAETDVDFVPLPHRLPELGPRRVKAIERGWRLTP